MRTRPTLPASRRTLFRGRREPTTSATVRMPERIRTFFISDRRKQRYDRPFHRWLCVRIDPLCVCGRASRNAQLPLQRLPALQWRPFRFGFHFSGIRHRDHGYAENVLGPRRERRPCDSQLLPRLRFPSVHAWRSRARSHVHPFFHAGQSVGISAYAGHLDLQCATLGLPQSGNSSLSSITLASFNG